MLKEAILTKEAPATIGPYSQAVRVGNLLFCSGQIPLDPVTGVVIGQAGAVADVKAQTKQVMENIAAVLKAAGATFDQIAKTTIYLKSMNDFPMVNEVYGSYFKGVPPARSTVEVARLPKDVSVEVDVTAVLG